MSGRGSEPRKARRRRLCAEHYQAAHQARCQQAAHRNQEREASAPASLSLRRGKNSVRLGFEELESRNALSPMFGIGTSVGWYAADLAEAVDMADALVCHTAECPGTEAAIAVLW